MTDRLLVAYFLIAMVAAGLGAAIWWLAHDSERQKLRRYYKAKHDRSKS